jgi:pilus assembly protein CpaE
MMSTIQADTPENTTEHIAPAPRVSVQAFCEAVETAAAVQAAGEIFLLRRSWRRTEAAS